VSAELHHLPEPKPRLHCASCGVTVEARCGCGVGYISAAEAAARAVNAMPEKSSRAIAEEIGVSASTIDRARKATASNEAVAKRTGRDGKKRRSPVKRAPRKHSQETRQRAASLVLDEGRTHDEAAAATGVSDIIVRTEIAREEGRREGRQAMLDYRHAELHREYQRVLMSRRGGIPIMQPADYRLILSALHPDSRAALSDERLAEAFATFRKYRLLLVNEATEPTPTPERAP
jgi:transposase